MKKYSKIRVFKIIVAFAMASGILGVAVLMSVALLEKNTPNAAQKPKTLKIAYRENVGALNPQGYSKNAMFAQNLLYEGLVRLDKEGKIVPSLATSWGVDKSGQIYTFSLRKGVKFSNGEDFGADAVVLNFTSILKNRARHSWSGLAYAIKSVEKIDDYAVRIVLNAPYTPTLNELALVRPYRFLAPSAFPPDLDLVRVNPQPIGTGAYILAQSKNGVFDKFTPNPHYWDAQRLKEKGGLYYDEVFIKVIFEPTSKLTALRAGQVDMLYGYDEIPTRLFQEAMGESMAERDTTGDAQISDDSHFDATLCPIENPFCHTSALQKAEVSHISNNRDFSLATQTQNDKKEYIWALPQYDKNTPAIKAYLGQSAFVLSLMLNSTRLDSPLREAIALSIDKQSAINAVYGKLASPADSIFLYTDFVASQTPQHSEFKPKSTPSATNKTPAQYAQNLQKAREILASYGYTQDNPLKIELLFEGIKPNQKMLAQILQAQLKSANIALSLRGLESSIFYRHREKGEFDMAFDESWGAPYEPLSMLYSYTIKGGHGDYVAQSGLANKPEIDALILRILSESNAHKAQILAHKAIDLLLQSGVYIPLAIERNKAVAHSRIKGVEGVSTLSYEIPIWEFYE